MVGSARDVAAFPILIAMAVQLGCAGAAPGPSVLDGMGPITLREAKFSSIAGYRACGATTKQAISIKGQTVPVNTQLLGLCTDAKKVVLPVHYTSIWEIEPTALHPDPGVLVQRPDKTFVRLRREGERWTESDAFAESKTIAIYDKKAEMKTRIKYLLWVYYFARDPMRVEILGDGHEVVATLAGVQSVVANGPTCILGYGKGGEEAKQLALMDGTPTSPVFESHLLVKVDAKRWALKGEGDALLPIDANTGTPHAPQIPGQTYKLFRSNVGTPVGYLVKLPTKRSDDYMLTDLDTNVLLPRLVDPEAFEIEYDDYTVSMDGPRERIKRKGNVIMAKAMTGEGWVAFDTFELLTGKITPLAFATDKAALARQAQITLSLREEKNEAALAKSLGERDAALAEAYAKSVAEEKRVYDARIAAYQSGMKSWCLGAYNREGHVHYLTGAIARCEEFLSEDQMATAERLLEEHRTAQQWQNRVQPAHNQNTGEWTGVGSTAWFKQGQYNAYVSGHTDYNVNTGKYRWE